MPGELTLAIEDALRQALPIACHVTLSIDDAVRHEREFAAGQRVGRFTGLDSSRVWTIRARAPGFAPAARLVDVASGERETALLCLADVGRVRPELPRYEQLPGELRTVLERSETLDITLAPRSLTVNASSARSLPARTATPSRLADGRIAGNPADGARRWSWLPADEERAGLLNLHAKMRAVLVGPEKRDVWSYVDQLFSIARDRIQASVHRDLPLVAAATAIFHEPFELKGLFHPPPHGFRSWTSLKTKEPFGNLQLTFFRADEDPTEVRVDADIDDAAGVAHGEQVLRNTSRTWFKKVFGHIVPGLPDGLTHPFNIHQLVIRHQGLPGPLPDGLTRYQPLYKIRVAGLPADYAI